MKAKPILIAATVVVALVGLRYVIQLLQAPDETPQTIVAPVAETAAPEPAVETGSWQASGDAFSIYEAPEPAEEEAEAAPEELIAQYGFDPAKIAALRAAKEGDPRTPPIKRGPERELPTAAELADPELYLQYEERQTKQLFAGYVKAVDPKIAQIEAIIEEGKKHGISEEDIAQAEEKIRKLREMKEELMTKYPGLQEVETPHLDLSQFESKD